MIGNSIAGFLGTGVAVAASSYESISTVTVGVGGSANVTFSSIPSTYTHLQVRFSTIKSNAVNMDMIFNGDSSNAYSIHVLDGNGSAVSAVGYQANNTRTYVGYTSVTTYPNVGIIDVLDYTSSKIKVMRCFAGADGNGSGGVTLQSGMWNNTAAITSLRLAAAAGTLNQYSTFALYGIKG